MGRDGDRTGACIPHELACVPAMRASVCALVCSSAHAHGKRATTMAFEICSAQTEQFRCERACLRARARQKRARPCRRAGVRFI